MANTMFGAFTAVDLSKLPAPDAVQQLDYEAILADMSQDFQRRMSAVGKAFTALLESDPAFKNMEVAAYRETLVRQRANEEVMAVMLAYAQGADLDQIGANFGVERLVLVPADPEAVPPVEAVMEANDDFRRRIQLSFEGFSTAGPTGAYIFHALGADGDVLDVGVDSPRFDSYIPPQDMQMPAELPESLVMLICTYDAGLAKPMPGDVVISILSRLDNGVASGEILDAVDAVLSDESIRPLTDHVIVKSAEIVEYTVQAELTVYNGPDSGVVLRTARDALNAYTEKMHRIGLDVTRSGLYAALHQEGVQNVNLILPAEDIVIGKREASYCTGTDITIAGVDE